MPLDDAAEKVGASLDAFGMRVDDTTAKLHSLFNFLMLQDIGKFKPTSVFGNYDPSKVGKLGFAQIGGDLAFPLNALAGILMKLDTLGYLDDPEKLRAISGAIGRAQSNFGLDFRSRDDLVNWLTDAVRRKTHPGFVEALRGAFKELFA